MAWTGRIGSAVAGACLGLAMLAAPASAATSPCTAAQLGASFGASDGAAGTIYNVLVLTNVSGAACTMKGYPGLQRFAPNGRAQATTLSTTLTPTPTTVRLAPGAKASFWWAYTDVPTGTAQSCAKTRVLAVSAPGSGARLYLATSIPYCSPSLRVSAVAAGVLTP